jgi:hypothetical protein
MDVQASPDERPELNECLGSSQGRFRRLEGANALERYTTGLLTGLPTKHGDTIAQPCPAPASNACRRFSPPCHGPRRTCIASGRPS